MIAEPKPYPAYYPVEESWLGQIPVGWSRKRLLAGFSSRAVKNEGLRETQVLSLSYGKIVVKRAEDLHGLVPASFESYQLIDPGDIVIRGTDLQNDQRSLRVGQAENHGIITSAYTRLIPRKNLNPRFAYLLLHGYDVMKALYGYGSGLRQTLDLNDLQRLPIVVPPLEDQAAIVRYVDHVDSRIGRLIAAKERLVKLSEEEIAAEAASLMERPDCRDARLSTIAGQSLRPVQRIASETYSALGIHNRGRGLFHKPPIRGDELGDSSFSWVEPGDLIISGQFAWEGAIALASSDERDTIVSHRYYLLRGLPNRALTPYLWALLRSDFGSMLLDQHSRGAAGRNRPLNIRTLLKEKVPVPPVEAQARLSDKVQALSPSRSQVAAATALLREYRDRLISDAVTGKFDVREAARELPADPSEDLAGDDELVEEAIA